jgi:hypothetical protein
VEFIKAGSYNGGLLMSILLKLRKSIRSKISLDWKKTFRDILASFGVGSSKNLREAETEHTIHYRKFLRIKSA